MRIKATVSYPWAGVPDDYTIIDTDDNLTEKQIEAIANEFIEDMVWSTVSTNWEVLE